METFSFKWRGWKSSRVIICAGDALIRVTSSKHQTIPKVIGKDWGFGIMKTHPFTLKERLSPFPSSAKEPSSCHLPHPRDSTHFRTNHHSLCWWTCHKVSTTLLVIWACPSHIVMLVVCLSLQHRLSGLLKNRNSFFIFKVFLGNIRDKTI